MSFFDQDHHPLEEALSAQSPFWSEFRVECGGMEESWTTARAFFDDAAAIDAFMNYERSHHSHMDDKTCAALVMIDYCYVFMLATIPLVAASGIVPDLTPERIALRMFDDRHDHDGEVHDVRRADIRYLSHRFSTDRLSLGHHPDATLLSGREELCDAFRIAIENHFSALIEVLVKRSGLGRPALWRLVADAVAGRWLEVGRQLNCLGQARQDAMRVVKHTGSPLYNKQLHFFDLTLHDYNCKPIGSWTFRARGGCCRYYTVAEGALCSTCVLKKPEIRDAELLDTMRRHVALLTAGQPT
ncbi:ferric iron reductase [Shinella oryzae]|uniref:Ferric iron reductase n=1 Tax=Shinella oryzae TaxID=2871820 RepID=A0ABY9KE73_9HYPH|nr:ferric iron reductase [Shinella oryzae]WLS05327.1 ferric iron reductase [Shinella oryzae]